MERRSLIRPLSKVGTGLPAHVSIDEGLLRLVDNEGKETNPLPWIDCVILNVNEKKSRIYYGAKYQKGMPSRPLCFSDNGKAPSDRCDEPQAISCQPDPEGKKGCRWSVWGSDTSSLTGKGIPACREYAKIAILWVAQNENKKWIPAVPKNPGLVFYFAVPPGSFRALSDYAKKCYGNVMGPLPWGDKQEVDPDLCMGYIVTRITLAGGRVSFEKRDFITEEINDVINNQVDDYLVDDIIGKNDVPIAAALPSPMEKTTNLTDLSSEPQPTALPEPTPPIAATPRPRGRPRKNGNAPVTTPARIVTSEEVRDHAAQQKQEAKEAAEEENPEPPADVLDQFMNLDLK